MTLKEEDKKKIKDFILNKSNVDPTESMSQNDKEEALKYAKFLMSQAMLKGLSKLCKKMR